MEQNSTKWFEWRKEGIGGSDVAAVLGISPWRSTQQLYEEKISPHNPFEETANDNYAMSLGKRLEPRARALFEINMGKKFPPKILEHSTYPFLRCSIDGKSDDNELVEFKYTGKQKDKIPNYYMVQMQYQMMIADSGICYYQAYDKTESKDVRLHPAIPVLANKDTQKDIFYAVRNFWENHIIPRIAPNASLFIGDDVEFKMSEWKRLCTLIEALEAEKEIIEKWAKAQLKTDYAEVYGVELLRVTRKGNVEYGRIPQLQGVNLDEYRKPDTSFIQMKLAKSHGKEN